MFWAVTGLVVVLLAFWIPTLRRRALLENALRFGREFYGIDLETLVGIGTQRQLVIRQIKTRGERTPQAVFFMLVPSILGLFDEMKKLELYDGLHQLQISGDVSELTIDEFLSEYEQSADEEYDWAASGLYPKGMI